MSKVTNADKVWELLREMEHRLKLLEGYAGWVRQEYPCQEMAGYIADGVDLVYWQDWPRFRDRLKAVLLEEGLQVPQVGGETVEAEEVAHV